jgi:hypothetical protein
MVLYATFNNLSAISWRLVLLVYETGIPRVNHPPAARCCVETSAKNNLGVQDDVSLLPEQFLRKRHEQKGPLKLHCCSLHKLKLDQKNPNYR